MTTRPTFRWSTWLGWQLESNWTEPWLFVIYVLLKPLTSSLLLVCMYYAAREVAVSKVPVQFLPFMYVSNACYMLVGAVMFARGWLGGALRKSLSLLEAVALTTPVPPLVR